MCGLIYENGAFHCNQLEHHSRRDSRLVPETHFQESWTTKEYYLRPRYPVRGEIYGMATGASGNKGKSKHSLPSAARWANRANEPDDGTVPEDLL